MKFLINLNHKRTTLTLAKCIMQNKKNSDRKLNSLKNQELLTIHKTNSQRFQKSKESLDKSYVKSNLH